jgi:hypothetical protein
MKVYVIVASNGILGSTGCAGVFDSKEKAEQAVKEMEWGFDAHIISECDLNVNKPF